MPHETSNLWVLRVFYTMNHEVVPRPCKICDWLVDSSRDHFGLHQGRNIRMTMELEVPKRHILRPTLSTNMVEWVLWWERQKRCSSRLRQGPMAQTCCYNILLVKLILEKRNEDKRMVKLNFFPLQNYPYWAYIRQINTFTFWYVVIPLGPHSIYTQ